ncbi:MAG: hypothetical protein AB7N76_18685 [Planctomycetota bacterium]
MTRRSSVGTSLFLAALAAIGLLSASPFGATPAEAGGERRKLSEREMKKLMNRWARELGVKCDYCHVRKGEEFDFEAKTEKKAIAAYCDDEFVAKLLTAKKKEVSCQDCHNKKATFLPRKKEEEKK